MENFFITLVQMRLKITERFFGFHNTIIFLSLHFYGYKLVILCLFHLFQLLTILYKLVKSRLEPICDQIESSSYQYYLLFVLVDPIRNFIITVVKLFVFFLVKLQWSCFNLLLLPVQNTSDAQWLRI